MAASMPHNAYFIHLRLTHSTIARGIIAIAATENTAYFMPQSFLLSGENGFVSRPMSWAVGMSFFTNTLYSERSSLGT